MINSKIIDILKFQYQKWRKNISIFLKDEERKKNKFNQIMHVLYFVLFLLLLAERMDENMP